MTREEAIQEFQNVKDLIRQYGKDWFDERDLELIDMAIEALSAEAVSREEKENDKLNTCNNHSNNADADYKPHIRLINADALIDLLKARKQFFVDAYGGFHYMSEKDKARCDEIDACIASIVNAPTVSADAGQEWIPCSERLPSENRTYLVSGIVKTPIFGIEGNAIDFARFSDGKWLFNGKENASVTVTAWQPLPTPYKGGDTE